MRINYLIILLIPDSEIARRHLIPKAVKTSGLGALVSAVSLSDEVLDKIMNEYAREPGVRQFGHALERIMRKQALKLVQEDGMALPKSTGEHRSKGAPTSGLQSPTSASGAEIVNPAPDEIIVEHAGENDAAVEPRVGVIEGAESESTKLPETVITAEIVTKSLGKPKFPRASKAFLY